MLKKAFEEALGTQMTEDSDTLSQSIEEEIHKQSKTRTEYFETFKAKYLNLKEPGNTWLTSAVYAGHIPVANFVRMTADEMKSQKLKEYDDEVLKRSILDSTVQRLQAETDMFFCTRCRQKKCVYRQLQTRSADEPMTTYVHCVTCGNKWKFC